MAKKSKGKEQSVVRKRATAAVSQRGKKVVWPTKKELGSFTAVVLATCAAFALVFWAVDTGVLAAIRAVCF